MKRLIKRFAKWILSEERESNAELIVRLKGYCRPHLPELKSDGSDQSKSIQMHLDVNSSAYFPKGQYYVGCTIKMPSKGSMIGEGPTTTIEDNQNAFECQECKKVGIVPDEITLLPQAVFIDDQSQSKIRCKCSNGHVYKVSVYVENNL